MLSVPSFLLVMIESCSPTRLISVFVISYSCIKRKSSSQSSLYFGHWLVKGNTTCQLSTSCEIISFGKFQFNISFEFLNWSFSVLATRQVEMAFGPTRQVEMAFVQTAPFRLETCLQTVVSSRETFLTLPGSLLFQKI